MIAGLSVAAALVISACGSSKPAATGSSKPAGTGAATGTSTATSTSPGAADPNATLRVAYHLEPSSLDPYALTESQQASYLQPAYDSLLELTPDLKLVPMLATAYSFSANDLALNLTLRQGVTFHDGTPFNGAAVKANLDRLLADKTSPIFSYVEYVSGVKVTGTYSVSVTLTKPDAALPTILSTQAGMMISPKLLAEPQNIATHEDGTGPYKVTSYKADNEITFQRDATAWDASQAGVETLVMTYVNDGQARLNGLQAGQFDLAYLTPTQFVQAKKDGLKTAQQAGLWYIQLFQDRSLDKLSNLSLRQAVAHAIDRSAICQDVYFGLCNPMSGTFPVGYWALDPSITANYFNYDPAIAKQLVQRNGLTGQKLSIEYPAGSDPYPQFAELIQSELEAVGLKVTLEPININDLIGPYVTNKTADMLLAGGGQVADPALELASQFTSTSFVNPSGTNAGLDPLIAQAREATNQTQREALMHQITKTLAQQVIDLPLVQPLTLYAMSKKVIDFQPTQLGAYMPTRGVELTK